MEAKYETRRTGRTNDSESSEDRDLYRGTVGLGSGSINPFQPQQMGGVRNEAEALGLHRKFHFMYNKVWPAIEKCRYDEMGEILVNDWNTCLTTDHQKALKKFVKESASPFKFLARDDPKGSI